MDLIWSLWCDLATNSMVGEATSSMGSRWFEACENLSSWTGLERGLQTHSWSGVVRKPVSLGLLNSIWLGMIHAWVGYANSWEPWLWGLNHRRLKWSDSFRHMIDQMQLDGIAHMAFINQLYWVRNGTTYYVWKKCENIRKLSGPWTTRGQPVERI